MKERKKHIRPALVETLGEMFPDAKSLREAAKELGISFESARQARDYGKGSVDTIMGLILYGFKITPSSLSKNLPKLVKMFEQSPEKSSQLAVLEKLFAELLSKYDLNQIIAWFRLLNARYDIESELGIREKSGRLKQAQKQSK